MDHEIDITLQTIFENVDMGRTLPISEAILHSMLFYLVNRDVPLSVFHENFIREECQCGDVALTK